MRVCYFAVWAAACAMGTACGDDGGSGGTGNGDGGVGGGDGGLHGDGGGGDAIDPASCKRVDLVFSVDPSSSMTEELSAMSTDVFPAFATALRDIGAGLEDYRVGVLDGCPDPADFHTRGQDNPDCNFQSGEVWMDSASTALAAEFACVGDIYQEGNCAAFDNMDEQPASAAATALEPPFRDGANAGFLRDDALLVIVAITDEDEQPCAMGPCPPDPVPSAQDVFNRLVATKGNVKKIVFLGIGGGAGGCMPGFYGDADEAVLLRQTTDRFIAEERGVFWDLCAGQLQDGLTEAMEVIEQACAELPPVP